MGWLWPCPQILRPDWKGFQRANPLAYLASSSVMKEKSFITLTPGWHNSDMAMTNTLAYYAWMANDGDTSLALVGKPCTVVKPILAVTNTLMFH